MSALRTVLKEKDGIFFQIKDQNQREFLSPGQRAHLRILIYKSLEFPSIEFFSVTENYLVFFTSHDGTGAQETGLNTGILAIAIAMSNKVIFL